MGCQKDINDLLKTARKQHFRQESTARGRWKVISPDGKKKTYVAQSASDYHALPKSKKKLRAIGVQFNS